MQQPSDLTRSAKHLTVNASPARSSLRHSSDQSNLPLINAASQQALQTEASPKLVGYRQRNRKQNSISGNKKPNHLNLPSTIAHEVGVSDYVL